MPLKDWLKDFRRSRESNLSSSKNNNKGAGENRQLVLVNNTLRVVQEKNSLLPPNIDLTVSCPVHRYSRLKPTLTHVFKDKEVLSAFIQYMESQGVGNLVQFCLQAEAFASYYSPGSSASTTAPTVEPGAEGDEEDKDEKTDCDTEEEEVEEKKEEEEEDAENEEIEADRELERRSDDLPGLDPKESDALAIYHRFLAPESSNIIPVPDELRNAAIKNICSDRGDIPGDAFRPCRGFVLRTIEERYFPSFLQSEQFIRWQIDFLTNRRATLADFLYHESAMFYLREFMENEDLTRLLVFVLAVDTYRDLIKDPSCTPLQALEYAMDLYEKYFSLQATSPLGFDDSIRMEVECSICDVKGPDPESFERSRQIVLQYIEKYFLSGFLNSQLFYKYLGELVYTVQTSDFAGIPRMRPRRLASDSESLSALLSPSISSHGETSSIHSEPVSSRNTLLAGATPQERSLRRALDRVSGGELRISETLSGINAPWSRGVHQALSTVGTSEGRSTGGSSNGSMSLGHIDEFGLFHSEVEQSPSNEQTILSTVFKKSKDKKQAEEDMALRIAKMVIKDVQDLTASAQSTSGPS